MIELDRAKELAKKRHMTLREVNDAAGLGTNSIYNWKRKSPGSDALAAVADVLNTSIDYLKGKTDNPSPAPNEGEVRSIPLDEDKPYSYHGYNVPEEYLDIIHSLMERDIERGFVKRDEDGKSE